MAGVILCKGYIAFHVTMPQGLLKRLEVLQKCKNIWLLSVRNAFKRSFEAKSQRGVRLHPCESIFFAPSYVNSLRKNRLKCCNLHDTIYIFLDNGVKTTPKRWILSFVFTVSCFKKSLLIHWFLSFYSVWSESICVPCTVWVSLVALFWCYVKLPREHGGRKLLVGLMLNYVPLGQIIITDHFCRVRLLLK